MAVTWRSMVFKHRVPRHLSKKTCRKWIRKNHALLFQGLYVALQLHHLPKMVGRKPFASPPTSSTGTLAPCDPLEAKLSQEKLHRKKHPCIDAADHLSPSLHARLLRAFLLYPPIDVNQSRPSYFSAWCTSCYLHYSASRAFPFPETSTTPADP